MRRLTGVVQPYAWGSADFVPALLGEEPTGEPQAELWLGAHPSAPALVDGRPLDALIAERPEAVVGPRSVAAFGPVLPYLMKVLSAAEPLSLQAHPSRAQAEAGFAAEEDAGVPLDAPERTYRDAWPKPEMLCALTDAEVLCGFAEPAETYAAFRELGVPAALELVAPLRSGGAAQLERVLARILRLSDSELDVIGDVTRAAAEAPGDVARTARELGQRYPSDPGVLAALLMNRMRLHRFDGVFLPAGNLHAYLHGSGIEIMANSNNVLRGGLTSKHVDVEELTKVLDFTTGVPPLVSAIEEQPGVWRYATPAPEFALWRLMAGDDERLVPSADSGRIVLVTDGSFSARSAGDELALARGGAALFEAGEDVTLHGIGVAFVAGPGATGS